MEGIFLVLLLIVGALFLLPIVAIARANKAVEQARQLAERVRSLEFQHEALSAALALAKSQLQKLSRGTHAPEAAPVPTENISAPVAAENTPAPAGLPPAPLDWGAATLGSTWSPPPARAPAQMGESAPPSAPSAPQAAEPPPPGAVDEAPPPAPPPTSASEPFEWERWVGVRGAAVLGAIVLALAAFLFFRYAIEHSLLSPSLRVVLGTLVGVSALVAAEPLRKRYDVTAHALAGGGMVVLYATFWAARALYQLIGMEVAFAVMALTTAVGCLLAVRYASLLIAVLGLVGGFLTPLLLSSGQDRPLGLFGYVLLLDTGFILAARKRGWSVVLGLLLLGTLLLEAAWIATRMGPARTELGLGIVAVFIGVFVVAASTPPQKGRASWFLTQAAALLLPLGFALYFATLAAQGSQLWPLCLLLGLIAAGACFVARGNPSASWLPLASAVGSTAVIAVWLSSATLSAASAWEATLCALGLAAIYRLFAALERADEQVVVASRPAIVAELGLFACLLGAASFGPVARVEPWLTGFVGLAALLLTHGRLAARDLLSALSAALLGFGLVAFQRAHAKADELPEPSAYFAIEVALALALQVLSLARPRADRHLAAAVFPGVILFGALWQHVLRSPPSALEMLGPSLALGALCFFAGTRSRDARWLPPAAFVWVIAYDAGLASVGLEPAEARVAFALGGVALLFSAIWPALVQTRLEQPRWALYVAALSGPAWFLLLRSLYERGFGAGSIGVLPVALGALSLMMLRSAARSTTLSPGLRRSALVWHAAVALGFASVAIPLQLDQQWITIGWALESAAVLFLFRRLDHAGLKWFGLALALATSLRLLVNPAVLRYEERGGLPFFNWLLYTYWVPALALLAGYFLLKDLELPRARAWEAAIYRKGQAWGATGLLLGVIVLVFAWLNLAIVDAFSEGSTLVLDLPRRPARDLTISLSWVGYAGALLALGMVKGSRGLRWLSLGFLILSIGKVFLYDLGQLRDLYRVLSLLGLAVSLLAVSLAYQRFVFRREHASGSP